MNAPSSPEKSAIHHPDHQFVVDLTETQRRLVFKAINAIKTYSNTHSMAVALFYASLEYLGSMDPPTHGPIEGESRRPLRFGVYEDAIESFHLALDEAGKRGCTSAGWAFTEICASVIAPGGTCFEMFAG